VGIAAISALAWGLLNLTSSIVPLGWKSPRMSLPAAGFFILACIATMVWLLHPLNTSSATLLKWPDKQETISRQTFLNTTVPIDGKRFDHVIFTNVTFWEPPDTSETIEVIPPETLPSPIRQFPPETGELWGR
jgi:hypothetical protein